MAKKQVSITFYDVSQCGFYKWGAKTPVLGGLVQALQELKDWSDGKAIPLTKLKQSRRDDDVMPVYLRGVDRLGDDWTVATWNEVPAGEGGVASISERSIVGGKQQVFANEFEKNSIPGFATYFWFVPSANVVATLRMEGSVAAKEPMRGYVEAFIETRSSFVVEDADGTIVGYRDPACAESKPLKLYPKFRLSPYVKPGALARIRAARDQIVKVIRVGHLELTNPVDAAAFGGVLAFFRGANRKRQITRDRQLRVELELTPTERELEKMIKEELGAKRRSSWEDLGFALKGETSKVLWVSKSMARDIFEMDLRVDEAGVVDLASLKEELAKRRKHILRILQNE
ncbi:hypothetical protein [uncultured Castellaniella sp.]|uniref:hypothetical protein n=1 Tax=uncultured Castellaniella sp. TaxID=647907 RepID=UPI00261C5AC6|nr:hypothetical protein [uncultured Castellaniella sp.]